VIEVLTGELKVLQSIQVGATVLDVTFHGDVMYVSLDVKEGNWIAEYRGEDGGWTRVDTGDQWQISTWEETKAELYWLETMRKRVGEPED
jgi:hypothetical protein